MRLRMAGRGPILPLSSVWPQASIPNYYVARGYDMYVPVQLGTPQKQSIRQGFKRQEFIWTSRGHAWGRGRKGYRHAARRTARTH